MRFWLGVHQPNWLETEVELFVSRRRLFKRKTMPVAAGEWVLDSGGFTELSLYGEWRTTEAQYIADVKRYAEEIGGLAWAGVGGSDGLDVRAVHAAQDEAVSARAPEPYGRKLPPPTRRTR